MCLELSVRALGGGGSFCLMGYFIRELTEQSGISPIPSFEVSIGIDGKAEVKRIEDVAVKEKVEDVLNGLRAAKWHWQTSK